MASTSLQRRNANPAPPNHLQFELLCDFASVRQGAEKLRGFLQAKGLLEADLWACELAFVEACNNVVQHTPAAHYLQPLCIKVTRTPAEVELQIQDEGPGFDFPESVDLPRAENENGRGLYLMRTLMSQVEYIRGDAGNCLVMKRKLEFI